MSAVEEAGAGDVERLFATNVFGLLTVSRAVLPHLRRQRSGHVINMSSVGGDDSYAGWGVYCATKFAVEGLTEAMAAEHQRVAAELATWRELSLSTDGFDAAS